MTSVSLTVEGLIRLGWQAELEGRPRLCDAMLTLAVAESGPDDAVLADRCRRRLVARQPGHWFATVATIGQALTHKKVAAALDRLRVMFPPVRVQWMLRRGAVTRGPYTGPPSAFDQVLADLGLVPRPAPAAKSREQMRSLPFPPLETPALDDQGETNGDDAPTLTAVYLAVLFSMAVLLQVVREESAAARTSGRGEKTRAA